MTKYIGAVCAGLVSLACSGLLESTDATFDEHDAPVYEFSDYLKADRPEQGAWFGYVVGAADGVVVTSAPFETVNGHSRAGAVYVFEQQEGKWTKKRITLPNAAVNDGELPELFPGDVPAIKGGWGGIGLRFTDDYLVMTVPTDDSGKRDDPFDDSAPASGAVYFYERGNLAAEPDYLKAPHIETNDLFGFTIAQSGDWVAISAPGEDSAPGAEPLDNSAPDSGAVYLYRSGARGLEFDRLEKPRELKEGAFFGSALAMSGNVLAVGAFNEDGESGATLLKDVGAAYVYRLVDDSWSFESRLQPPTDDTSGFFGTTLAISGDVLAVGATGWTSCGAGEPRTGYRGAVFIATPKASDWSIDQCLSPRSVDRTNAFGWRVSMWNETLVVAALGDAARNADEPLDSSLPFSGAVYVFQRNVSGGAWVDKQYLKAPNPDAFDNFGHWVAITRGLIAVGAPRESGEGTGPEPDFDNGSFEAGAVYIFKEVAEP